jgi:hypothetical protein
MGQLDSTCVQPHHRHPAATAHLSTSRCPPSAAEVQVSASQGHPVARAHCSTGKQPPTAAKAHTTSQG